MAGECTAIDNFVREEVLYREALRMKLEKLEEQERLTLVEISEIDAFLELWQD